MRRRVLFLEISRIRISLIGWGSRILRFVSFIFSREPIPFVSFGSGVNQMSWLTSGSGRNTFVWSPFDLLSAPVTPGLFKGDIWMGIRRYYYRTVPLINLFKDSGLSKWSGSTHVPNRFLDLILKDGLQRFRSPVSPEYRLLSLIQV